MITAGIDAGGSKTECIIVDSENDKILARAVAGPANYQVVGLKKACLEIKSALEKAKAKAGIDKLSVLALGIAGAGRKNDKVRLKKELSRILEPGKIFLTDDAHIALLGATGGRAGIILIAGTGSIAFGLKKSGDTIRSGGWGPLIGDEGSGFWIALEAIKRAVRADENRDPATKLVDLIPEYFDFSSFQELIPFIYEGEFPRRQIAALTPEIIKLAKVEADDTAIKIIEKAVAELALLAGSLKQRLDYQEEAIFVSGGLFKNKYFFNQFQKYLQKSYDLQTLKAKNSAVYGAVFLAQNKIKENNS